MEVISNPNLFSISNGGQSNGWSDRNKKRNEITIIVGDKLLLLRSQQNDS